MKKKVLALVLTAVMASTMMAACGNSESAAPAAEETAESGAAEEEEEEEEEDEEMAEVKVALMSLAPIDESASDAVEEAINELTEKDINVHVDISWYDAATYGTQVPMQIQANEKLDLIMYTPVPSASYASFMNSKQLLDITEYIESVGQDIMEIEGDFLAATSFRGGIYGVPNNLNKAGDMTMIVRKDLAEEAGVVEDLENATTWTEIQEAFIKIEEKSGLPGLVNTDAEGTVFYPRPYKLHGDTIADAYWYDNGGDGYNLIEINEETDTVECYYLTDDFKEMCERVSDWYSKDLVYKDAATSQDYGDTLVKAGSGFAEIRAMELGSVESSKAITGYDFVEIKITPNKVATNTCTKFGYAVPVTATEPEAAVKYLNYVFSSEEVMNLLAWGVEGRDYVINEDGQATYPEGVTADTVAYHTAEFLYGNLFKITPWEGTDLDIREQQMALNDAAEISKYLGFTVDNTDLENVATACYNVATQYHPALDSGSAEDWEAVYAEFVEKLEAAGINDLLAAYQEQLDTWLAEK